MALLVKYFKSQNPRPKKSKLKEELIEKCKKYVPDFDIIQDGPKTKAYIDKIWVQWKVDGDNPSKLRIISHIDITREEVNWFLNLQDNFVIDDELKLSIQEKRFPAKVGNKPMTFTRIKFLFTLFIWTKIQNEYMGYGIYHDLDECKAKLRKDANLPAGFNILNERNILEDLGFVKTTDKNVDTLAVFFENEPVFKTKLTDENRVTLSEEDLYNCGLWLEKQKYGSFVCDCCGNEFAYYSNKPNEKKRKYCKACAKKIKTHNPRKKYCIDCGEELLELVSGRRRERCSHCQSMFDNKKAAEGMRKLRMLRNKAISPESANP